MNLYLLYNLFNFRRVGLDCFHRISYPCLSREHPVGEAHGSWDDQEVGRDCHHLVVLPYLVVDLDLEDAYLDSCLGEDLYYLLEVLLMVHLVPWHQMVLFEAAAIHLVVLLDCLTTRSAVFALSLLL